MATIATGAGGWVLWTDGAHEARVRFLSREDGRLEAAELYVVGDVDGETLRSIPVGRLKTWANSPRGRTVLSALIAASAKDADQQRDAFIEWIDSGRQSVRTQRPRDLRLEIPAGRTRRPDSFYSKVAALHAALTASGSRSPAQEIASAQDPPVPVSTVHRWIKEARARSLSVPGQRGGSQ